MWTPFRLNNGRDGEFAGGWDTDVLNGHRVVFHIGAGMVEYAHLLDPDLTVILSTNNQGFNPYRMTIDVMRFIAPEVEKHNNKGDCRRITAYSDMPDCGRVRD
jgi:hypothetical protein